jgi:hypothetical protein
MEPPDPAERRLAERLSGGDQDARLADLLEGLASASASAFDSERGRAIAQSIRKRYEAEMDRARQLVDRLVALDPYLAKLVALTRDLLPSAEGGAAEVVGSALDSLMAGIEIGRSSGVGQPDLCLDLLRITLAKVEKRRGLAPADPLASIAADDDPTPEVAREFSEACLHLLKEADHEDERRIVELKLRRYSDQEIIAEMRDRCDPATVRRTLRTAGDRLRLYERAG